MKIYILFNKKTQKLISYTTDISLIPKDIFLIKEILLSDYDIKDNEFNLARYRWEGDFDSGKIVDFVSERKAIVSEEDVDRKYYELFFRKYSLETVLLELVRSMDSSHPMSGFLRALDAKKRKEIEFFQSSPNHIYETRANIQQRLKEAFSVDIPNESGIV